MTLQSEYEFLDVPLQDTTMEKWLHMVFAKSKDGWYLYNTSEDASKPGGMSMEINPDGSLRIVFAMDRILAMWRKAEKEGVVHFARVKQQ